MEIWHGHALCPNELYCVMLYLTLTILHSLIKLKNTKTNLASVLFVVKATALEQQIPEFYLQILSMEASFYTTGLYI